MVLTATDPVDGPLTFYWSDASFQADNLPSGPRVYPVIYSWGAMREMATFEGEIRDGDFEVRLYARAICVASNGTKRYAIKDIFQSINMQGVEVTVYQWSQDSNGQLPIWHGFLTGVAEGNTQGGATLARVRFSTVGKAMLVKIAPVVGTDIYLTAPRESRGKMPSRAYGKLINTMGPSALAEAMYLGIRSQFVEGVRIAEDNNNAQLTYEFARGDGARGMSGIANGFAGDPSVDCSYWVYLEGADAFGMIDAGDITPINDVTSLRATFNMGMRIWTPILPESVGPLMHTGLIASAYKVTNDDPNDFMQTTSTDYTIAFNVPPLSIPGFRCSQATVMIDVEGDGTGGSSTRTIDFGLWNAQHAPGPATGNWWGAAGTKGTVTINVGTGPTTRRRIFMGYPIVTFYRNDVGGDNPLGAGSTFSEFAAGNFIGRDASSNPQPIQVALSVTSGSKDKVRVYGMAVILGGTAGLYANRLVTVGARKPDFSGYSGWRQRVLEHRYSGGVPDYRSVPDPSAPGNTARVLVTGLMQKDSGTTYQGGGADAVIEKGSGIAHHLVRNMNPNATPGTLGNFPDAGVEAIPGEKAIQISIGGNPANFREALKQIQAIHPLRVHDKNGTMCAIYEEMNPHPSRQYRSSSEIVKIMGRDIEPGSFRYTVTDLENIVNTVRLNYGFGYRSAKPLGSTTYLNALSRELYGAREEVAADAPWIGMGDVTSPFTPAPATFMARFMGRRAGRPRATFTCALPQSYFDLELGHVTEFGDDMEAKGFEALLHRAGKVDYVLSNQTATSNSANNKTAEIVALTTDATYLGFSQQIDLIDYVMGVAGVYTNVTNAWKYSASEGGIGATTFDITWNPFSNVVNPHGFKALGAQRTSWDRPDPMSWKKCDILFGGGTYQAGPVYWAKYDYSTALTHAVLADVFSFPAKLAGRRIEVIEATRKLGGYGDYPVVELELQETM